MKIRLFLCLVVMFLIPDAAFSAGLQSGLPEELRMLVDSDGRFHNYTLLTADEDTLQGRPADLSLFVLTKGECCVLFVAIEEEDAWILQQYSRLSLYPKTKQNIDLQLLKVDNRHFEMKWPKESYLFSIGGGGFPACLCKAEFETEHGACVATREDDGAGMRFTCDGAETKWNLHENNQMIWPNFNPALFPKSIESVNRSNAVLNALPEKHFSEILLETKLLQNHVTVYNCPSDTSREVDNASLFSNETFVYYGNDGAWCTIGYQDGIERAYLGCIAIDQLRLGKRERDITRSHFDAVALVAYRDTWLTDDPVLSQKCYLEIPCGTTLIGLSGWDAGYVYAEVTTDGETIRGFVPIQDLALAEQ